VAAGPKARSSKTSTLTGIYGYLAQYPQAIIAPAMLRPSATQVIAYVLTAGDPAPIRAALQPLYGKRFCAAQSDYTAAQISAALNSLDITAPALTDAGGISTGQTMTPRGQICVEIDLSFVTPTVAAIATAQPDGLVLLRPWLVPVD